MVKVWLDDMRAAPAGWVRAYWPSEVISLLEAGVVTEISLDHDLGDDEKGTGYDVLKYVEEQLWVNHVLPPIMHVHSANGPAVFRMRQAIDSINEKAETVGKP